MATYRLLTLRDNLESGDEFSCDGLNWQPVGSHNIGEAFNPAVFVPHRRKISGDASNEILYRVETESGEAKIFTNEQLETTIRHGGLDGVKSINRIDESQTDLPIRNTKAPSPPETVRVTRISKGKTFNLGNYENERLDATVEIPATEKASDVLSQLEQLFHDIDPKNEKDDYEVKQARALLARPSEYIERDDLIKIAAAKQTIAEHQRRKERMKNARNILDHLGSESKYKDGKWTWDDKSDDEVPF